jgi:hypothetical protein
VHNACQKKPQDELLSCKGVPYMFLVAALSTLALAGIVCDVKTGKVGNSKQGSQCPAPLMFFGNLILVAAVTAASYKCLVHFLCNPDLKSEVNASTFLLAPSDPNKPEDIEDGVKVKVKAGVEAGAGSNKEEGVKDDEPPVADDWFSGKLTHYERRMPQQ